jgi:hypothetical protein
MQLNRSYMAWSRTFHRWLSWMVGVQVVVWLFTGFVMTLLSHGEVRSEHLIRTSPEISIPADIPVIAPNTVLGYFEKRGVPVSRLKLHYVGETLTYDVAATDGSRALLNAVTGQIVSPISQELASQVAMADRASTEIPVTIVLLDAPEEDYRGEVPVWRVEFDDADAARLYISPTTAEIVERTNTVWRIHDFVWMLHIMDYSERRDYNHLLVRVTAGAGLLLALTGTLLAALSIRRRLIPRSNDSDTGSRRTTAADDAAER